MKKKLILAATAFATVANIYASKPDSLGVPKIAPHYVVSKGDGDLEIKVAELRSELLAQKKEYEAEHDGKSPIGNLAAGNVLVLRVNDDGTYNSSFQHESLQRSARMTSRSGETRSLRTCMSFRTSTGSFVDEKEGFFDSTILSCDVEGIYQFVNDVILHETNGRNNPYKNAEKSNPLFGEMLIKSYNKFQDLLEKEDSLIYQMRNAPFISKLIDLVKQTEGKDISERFHMFEKSGITVLDKEGYRTPIALDTGFWYAVQCGIPPFLMQQTYVINGKTSQEKLSSLQGILDEIKKKKFEGTSPAKKNGFHFYWRDGQWEQSASDATDEIKLHYPFGHNLTSDMYVSQCYENAIRILMGYEWKLPNERGFHSYPNSTSTAWHCSFICEIMRLYKEMHDHLDSDDRFKILEESWLTVPNEDGYIIPIAYDVRFWEMMNSSHWGGIHFGEGNQVPSFLNPLNPDSKDEADSEWKASSRRGNAVENLTKKFQCVSISCTPKIKVATATIGAVSLVGGGSILLHHYWGGNSGLSLQPINGTLPLNGTNSSLVNGTNSVLAMAKTNSSWTNSTDSASIVNGTNSSFAFVNSTNEERTDVNSSWINSTDLIPTAESVRSTWTMEEEIPTVYRLDALYRLAANDSTICGLTDGNTKSTVKEDVDSVESMTEEFEQMSLKAGTEIQAATGNTEPTVEEAKAGALTPVDTDRETGATKSSDVQMPTANTDWRYQYMIQVKNHCREIWPENWLGRKACELYRVRKI